MLQQSAAGSWLTSLGAHGPGITSKHVHVEVWVDVGQAANLPWRQHGAGSTSTCSLHGGALGEQAARAGRAGTKQPALGEQAPSGGQTGRDGRAAWGKRLTSIGARCMCVFGDVGKAANLPWRQHGAGSTSTCSLHGGALATLLCACVGGRRVSG